MKRLPFIQFCIAAAAAPLASFTKFSGSRLRLPDKKGFMVGSKKDRFDKPLYVFEGDKFFTKISTSDTDGSLFIFESTRDKEGGPPLHYHFDQDEWWYVVSGEFLIKVGDQTYNAKAGDSVYGPRMVPHTFAKVGEGEARIILLFQPAGKMEAFFKAVADGTVGKMAEDEKNKFREAHGFKHMGPPLRQMKKS